MDSLPSRTLTLGQKQMIASVVLFMVMGVLTKYLLHLHFLQIVLVRSFLGLISCALVLHFKEIPFWPKEKSLLLLRGLFGTAALSLFFFSLYKLPLGAATVLANLTPIFGLFLGAWITQESVSMKQWCFFLISFFGVVLVKGFGSGISSLGVMAAIGGAFFSALAHQMIRKAEKREDPYRILFYFSLVSFFILTPFTIPRWTEPSWIDWGILLSLGLVTFAAQIFMTMSYQNGKVQEVSQFNFLQTILAVVFGFLLFGETVDAIALLGMGVIILGVFLSTRREK